MPKNMNILWLDNRWPWHKKAFTKATAQYKLRKSLAGRPVDSLSQLLFHMAEGHQKKKKGKQKNRHLYRKCIKSHHADKGLWSFVVLRHAVPQNRNRLHRRQGQSLNLAQNPGSKFYIHSPSYLLTWFTVWKHSFTEAFFRFLDYMLHHLLLRVRAELCSYNYHPLDNLAQLSLGGNDKTE